MSVVEERGPSSPSLKAASPRVSKAMMRLSVGAGLLGTVAAMVGLLWRGGGGAVTASTLLGQRVQLYGRGLYENDTLFVAANNLATDIAMIFLGVPLLTISLFMYARGSLRGLMILLGVQGFFLYYGATYALGGVAYNELFLVYAALFSVSLFAVLKSFTIFDLHTLKSTFSGRMPRRLPGAFMIGSGVATLVIWLMEPIASLLSGELPEGLETHTTLFTHALDLAVIVPAALVAGVMILRRQLFGYVVAFSLLVLESFLLPIIAIATLIQLNLGIQFRPGEIVGPIIGFGLLAAFSLWVITALLREVPSERRQEVSL